MRPLQLALTSSVGRVSSLALHATPTLLHNHGSKKKKHGDLLWTEDALAENAVAALTAVCCGLAVSPGKPPSHTARSGQEPHTAGRTMRALQVGGDRRKTAGRTKRAMQVGGERRKPRSHTARSGQEPHTAGGTKRVLRVQETARHTARSGQEPHTRPPET